VSIGWLSDRFFRTRRLRVAAPALLGLAAALFAYQWLGGVSLVGNALLLAAVGFLLFGPDSLISGTVSQEIGGRHATARVAGIINGLGSVGAIFSPLIVAWVSARFGWSLLFQGFVGLALVATLLLFLAQILMARPEPALCRR
jgi:sugar phosphate permease